MSSRTVPPLVYIRSTENGGVQVIDPNAGQIAITTLRADTFGIGTLEPGSNEPVVSGFAIVDHQFPHTKIGSDLMLFPAAMKVSSRQARSIGCEQLVISGRTEEAIRAFSFVYIGPGTALGLLRG
jgi:hypothetical protein